MSQLVKIDKTPDRSIPRASQVLIDYDYWLRKRYSASPAYLTNAKSFLRSYRQGGNVKAQLEDYISQKATSLRSILNRFLRFLEVRKFTYLINDLHESKLPLSNPFVKLFLLSNQDRLLSKGSMSIYATVLNGYFLSIKDDITRINKRTASKYILAPTLSDYTKRLYKSVLKAFCEWVLMYQVLDAKDLSREQRMVKSGLKKISVQSLREIAAIKVVIPRSLSGTYHKDSLSEPQRKRLLKLARTPKDKSILALMAWNGLRSIEVLRLNVGDIKLSQGKIMVWSKGKSEKAKDTIKLASVTKKELAIYLKKSKIKRGKVFPALTRLDLDTLIRKYFKKLRVKGKYSPHSLRHTAGQLMYEKNIPMELIQKTLRHADMRTTMMYAQKAIDKNYLKRMKRF
ncbi:MAG: site-specific integrase [Cyclobacteriaceae bacterium]|nr:site-specific integrase [Cyclobacteriaceae bacterium]MBX2957205.1 site-specific integrase [Cyclobacteriaceae bacterium]